VRRKYYNGKFIILHQKIMKLMKSRKIRPGYSGQGTDEGFFYAGK
jgi:hypothetical protein